jgi:hypothetical protein
MQGRGAWMRVPTSDFAAQTGHPPVMRANLRYYKELVCQSKDMQVPGATDFHGNGNGPILL